MKIIVYAESNRSETFTDFTDGEDTDKFNMKLDFLKYSGFKVVFKLEQR
jgi:hypothetical protein